MMRCQVPERVTIICQVPLAPDPTSLLIPWYHFASTTNRQVIL